MGRKRIGKLSCFSIAESVTVYTQRDGERTAFRMDAEDNRKQICAGDQGEYRPQEVGSWTTNLQSDGTCVVLRKLKRHITNLFQSELQNDPEGPDEFREEAHLPLRASPRMATAHGKLPRGTIVIALSSGIKSWRRPRLPSN